MKFIISYLVKKIGVAGVLIAVNILRFAFLVTFSIFILAAISTLKDSIQNLFSLFSDSSTFISSSLGILDVMGVMDAFTTMMPLIVSSIVFLLTAIAYKYTNSIYKEMVKQVNSLGGGLF